jgi:hypothetical protein
MSKAQQKKSAAPKDRVMRNMIKPMTAGKQKIKDGDAGFDTETSGLNEPVRARTKRSAKR